jgi:hypothetical protein
LHLPQVIIDLRLEIESLEKRLTGASKARERQLRKTAAAKRASLASQLKVMDAEVRGEGFLMQRKGRGLGTEGRKGFMHADVREQGREGGAPWVWRWGKTDGGWVSMRWWAAYKAVLGTTHPPPPHPHKYTHLLECCAGPAAGCPAQPVVIAVP